VRGAISEVRHMLRIITPSRYGALTTQGISAVRRRLW
jgi:hypothetical protein